MSKKLDQFRVTKKHDKRIKLTPYDKRRIKVLYAQGIGIREITRRIKKVSRRMIQFVLFPERLKISNYPGHWAKYYDKRKQTIAMRKHRNYKRKLLSKSNLTN